MIKLPFLKSGPLPGIFRPGSFHFLLLLFLSVFCSQQITAQEEKVDYNSYYRFPVSTGVAFQSMTALGDSPGGESFTIFDISGLFMFPIPSLPVLQPSFQGGYIKYQSKSDSDQWDHDQYYGSIGMMYSNRFAKSMELGFGGYTGLSQSVFKNLDSSSTSYGGLNLILDAVLKLGLDPSYNVNLDIFAKYRYSKSLNNVITEFDGGQIGFGIALNYRFGKNPDSATDLIRSLKFQNLQVDPLYAAMRSYYAANPIGTIQITNTEKKAVTNLEILFFQPGFMDSSTQSASIEELAPGESADVEIFALFNDQVFTTEGTTPLTAEIITEYSYGGRPVRQTQPISYDLYDKSAMQWDDDRKVASFITPADSALSNYTSFINQSTRENTLDAFNTPLQKAIKVYKALDVIGLTYQIDPITPFSSVQENQTSVDSVSLPRKTLKTTTGDCDDITVLYDSLLEVMGIETGFITVPGHIYSVFNTGISSRNHDLLHPDEDMMIYLDGEIWIPVEITMIGKTGFLEAWQDGADEWHNYDNNPNARGFYKTRESHQLYRPVALRETDLGLQYGSASEIARGYDRELNRLVDLVLEDQSRIAEESGETRDYNRLGITAAKLERYDLAERAFRKALNQDSNYLRARVNLGNILYLKDQYGPALAVYENAIVELEAAGKNESRSALSIYLNISKCHYQLEQYALARSSYENASAISADYSDKYSYLAAADTSGAVRASESDWESILFLGEEE